MTYKSFKRLWDHIVNIAVQTLAALCNFQLHNFRLQLQKFKNSNYSILEACAKYILVGIKAQ